LHLSRLFNILLERLRDPNHQFYQAAATYKTLSGTSVNILCEKYAALDLDGISNAALHEVCEKAVANYKADSFHLFFDSLKDFTNVLRKDKKKLLELHQKRPILLSNFESAFEFEYSGENGLKAFIEYLDRRWLTLVSVSDGTTRADSYCGTIVQSSCSGKSRLVEE